jgi:tRNA threonylcarbamoyladenosine biosynthesis protein TsaB
MVIVAIETVTAAGSLALWRDGRLDAIPGDSAEPHAARLPGALARFLATHDVALTDVDRLAVVAGPGSFTGVRIGMACAQGLATTRGWLVTPIPTLEALAWGWAHHVGRPGTPRQVMACLDGMRQEVFTAGYAWTGDTLIEVVAPAVGPPDPDAWPADAEAVGSGAVKYRDRWEARGMRVHDACEPLAAGAARLAARPERAGAAPHTLTPVYVRRPDVELARDRKRRLE